LHLTHNLFKGERGVFGPLHHSPNPWHQTQQYWENWFLERSVTILLNDPYSKLCSSLLLPLTYPSLCDMPIWKTLVLGCVYIYMHMFLKH
jgi:hypothetical protein